MGLEDDERGGKGRPTGSSQGRNSRRNTLGTCGKCKKNTINMIWINSIQINMLSPFLGPRCVQSWFYIGFASLFDAKYSTVAHLQDGASVQFLSPL